MKRMLLCILVTAAAVTAPKFAFADAFTLTSPAGGLLPSGISAVGGIVTDLVGVNGTRVVAQVAASTQYYGTEPVSSTQSIPQVILIGAQSGLSPAVVAALGGGLQSAAFRVTLYDGDNQAGDFDYNQNFFYVGSTQTGGVGTITATTDGVNLGNFSNVVTEETDGNGLAISNNNGKLTGFGDVTLDTGFFSSTDSTLLSSLYNSLVIASNRTQVLNFQLRDNTPGNNSYDQFYDFKQGLDASLVDVGSGPVVSTAPEPSSFLLLTSGIAAVAPFVRSRLRGQGR